jgi:cobalt/nickel transport system permease protein
MTNGHEHLGPGTAPHAHPQEGAAAAQGLHGHEHRHAEGPAHRHPHHHRVGPTPAAHEHTHATTFEALTYIISPVHALDARAKTVAAIVLVLGIVLSPPARGAEFALLVALLAAVALIARLPLGRLALRSAAVLPFAATIALLAPLQAAGGSWNAGGLMAATDGWVTAWGILSKAWLSASCMLLLAASTRTADLLAALRRLGVPDVFVLLLSFIARYVGVLGDQLRSLRTALASRAPRLRRRTLLHASGSIAGNLFVRSYERGERIHAAMLSRGYTGALPHAASARIGAAEVLSVIVATLSALAVALY